MRVLQIVGIAVLAALLATATASAVMITFQVDMSVQEQLGNFDAATDSVGLNGTMNNWGGDGVIRLFDDDEDMIYAATVELTAGDEEQYKYVIAPDGDFGALSWESIENRALTVPDTDTELEVVFFNNQESANPTFPYEIIFQVDMSVAIETEQFDPANDAVIIRGGHAALGNWGGYTALAQQGATDIYAIEIQFDALEVEIALEYKFVIDVDNDQSDPVIWEELPQGGNREFVPTGDEEDTDGDEFKNVILDPVYFADNPGGIESDLTVRFELDGRPAIRKHNDVGIPGVTGEEIEWFIVTGPWDNNWTWTPNDLGNYNLFDDGVDPDDTDGDSVFTTEIDFPAGTAINFVYKYGANGGDNEAGMGENRFIQLDDSEPVMVVQDEFGEQGDLYDDYLYVVEVPSASLPAEFTVGQNYPNPFNPTTTIEFALPSPGRTMLRVFNVTGQEVISEFIGNLNAGRYEVTIDASKLASGPYFYRIEANGLSVTKKMVVLK